LEKPRPAPVLGPYKQRIRELLDESDELPRKQRYTARTIYRIIRAEGYQGSEGGVHNYVSKQRKGSSIAANKVKGIRAALCGDAETARGARWWNDANVLVMSLRKTSTEVAKEILDAWFSEKVLEEEKIYVEQVSDIERRHSVK
jgi:RpiB/LacA/LacB family sugar-phosphate isomerase